MSTPVSLIEKTTRDATDLLTVTTQAGVSYKIKNQNFVQNLPTQENPFDIGELPEITSLADGDFFPLRDLSDGQDKKISKENLEDELGGGGSGSSYPYILLVERQTKGTHAGSFVSGARRTRDLNYEAVDTDNICSLSGGQFTLPSGTYRVLGYTTARAVNGWQSFLEDVDGEETLLEGSSSRSTYDNSKSWIHGQIVLTEESTLEVQCQCQTTVNNHGMGYKSDMSTATYEIYSALEIWKVG
jgi:hypothetical protein